MSRDIVHRKAGAGDAIGKGDGARCPSFREIGLPFGRVTRQENIFEHNSGGLTIKKP